MNAFFSELGDRIEAAWLQHHYKEEIFPQLVMEELERSPPSEHIEPGEIIDWIFSTSQRIAQPTPRTLFGEPPVMLFQAPRFYIEALFWLSGTTSIHEHSFSGVFAVLAGGSVHSHWRFINENTINTRMLCGRLERVSTEILHPGDMRPIFSGSRLIHQLFHLEMPSVTVVVRTYVDRNHLPQYLYLPPGLAVDPEDHDALRTRRLIFLDGMARGMIDGLQDYAVRFIEQGDLESLYYTFALLERRKVDPALLDDLYERARARHSDVVELFRQVCDEARRTRIVTAMRAKVTTPELRFLLALLMLLPDRDAILETIRLEFPALDPRAAIESWVGTMSGKDIIGFDFDDANKLIFRGLMDGVDMECILGRLRSEFRASSIDENRDQLVKHALKMAGSDLFQPLFSHSPLRV